MAVLAFQDLPKPHTGFIFASVCTRCLPPKPNLSKGQSSSLRPCSLQKSIPITTWTLRALYPHGLTLVVPSAHQSVALPQPPLPICLVSCCKTDLKHYRHSPPLCSVLRPASFQLPGILMISFVDVLFCLVFCVFLYPLWQL